MTPTGVPVRQPTAPFPGPPIYYQIARALESRIYHGLYRPGEAIPSEADFSREFGVTRLTVRQALQQLIGQGFLVPRRGSGTYVADDARVLRPVNFQGYLDDQALQPLTMDIELGQIEKMIAPDGVREHLRLTSRARVLMVERLRSLNGVPMNRAVNYLPLALARRLPLDKLTERSMTDLVREFGGVNVLSATQTLTAEAAPSDVAQRLHLNPGAPVLRSDFLVGDGARPVNYSVVHYRPDRTFFTASLISLPSLTGRTRTTHAG
ncbi:MAG: GntR family transcriptional regulator [Chloroflexota bacterium]